MPRPPANDRRPGMSGEEFADLRSEEGVVGCGVGSVAASGCVDGVSPCGWIAVVLIPDVETSASVAGEEADVITELAAAIWVQDLSERPSGTAECADGCTHRYVARHHDRSPASPSSCTTRISRSQ